MNQTFANAQVVQRDRTRLGWVRVEEGIVVEIGDGERVQPEAIDFQGAFLTPGLVDIHTDNLEKHVQPRQQVRWDPVTAAIAHDAQIIGAGITTVFDALAFIGGREKNDRPAMIRPMVEGLRQAANMDALKADHFLHLRCEVSDPEVMPLVEPFIGDPLVRMLSIMDHTPGQRQFRDLDKWREAYASWTDEDLDELYKRKTRAQTELAPIQRDGIARLAREMGAIIASHDDETAEHIQIAADLSVRISEFPVTFEAAEAARANGLSIAMGAPNLVRGGSHSGNVSAASLAKAGLLDILASDYVPVAMMQAALCLTRPPHEMPLHQALATVTWRPAEAAGLTDRGAIETGKKADLLHLQVAHDTPVIKAVWRSGTRVA
ncbi:MAG: alpha-D-ribose 1-methylphosphonate 5-triphosphate diphosphatase [Pseudomonadota bacterium]